jgi:hypothetical protein
MSTLEELQKWYMAQCDGDWEHAYGVKIITLDNPGWSITIDLEGTALEGLGFERISVERSEADWLVCRVEQERFLADGGPENLDEMLTVFLVWVEQPRAVSPSRR